MLIQRFKLYKSIKIKNETHLKYKQLVFDRPFELNA